MLTYFLQVSGVAISDMYFGNTGELSAHPGYWILRALHCPPWSAIRVMCSTAMQVSLLRIQDIKHWGHYTFLHGQQSRRWTVAMQESSWPIQDIEHWGRYTFPHDQLSGWCVQIRRWACSAFMALNIEGAILTPMINSHGDVYRGNAGGFRTLNIGGAIPSPGLAETADLRMMMQLCPLSQQTWYYFVCTKLFKHLNTLVQKRKICNKVYLNRTWKR